jgi:hypothetical protein
MERVRRIFRRSTNAQVSVAHLVRILFCIVTAATIGSIGAAGVGEHLQG